MRSTAWLSSVARSLLARSRTSRRRGTSAWAAARSSAVARSVASSVIGHRVPKQEYGRSGHLAPPPAVVVAFLPGAGGSTRPRISGSVRRLLRLPPVGASRRQEGRGNPGVLSLRRRLPSEASPAEVAKDGQDNN